MHRPAHLIDVMPRLHGKDAVWAFVLAAKKPFTATDVWNEINHNQPLEGETHISSVRDYLKRLESAKYLTSERPQNERFYRLVKSRSELQLLPPNLSNAGKYIDAKNGNQRMWRSIKVLREFDYKELAITAEVEPNTAMTYCGFLLKGGYLSVSTPANTHGGIARYRLIESRYSGPGAPKIQSTKSVYDPNLKIVVWPPADSQEGGGRHGA